MAFLDKDLILSDDQAITASANSTDIIDFGAKENWGISDIVRVIFTVTKAFASGGTLGIAIRNHRELDRSDVESTLATLAFTAAELAEVGSTKSFDIPANVAVEFLDASYTVGGTLTVGTIMAYIDMKKLGYKAVESGAAIE